MPADVRLHVDGKRLLAEGEGLLGLSLGIDDEGLHRHGIAVLGRLLEDLLGGLEAPLILLVFIVADNLTKEVGLSRAEGLGHRGDGGRTRRRWSRGTDWRRRPQWLQHGLRGRRAEDLRSGGVALAICGSRPAEDQPQGSRRARGLRKERWQGGGSQASGV